MKKIITIVAVALVAAAGTIYQVRGPLPSDAPLAVAEIAPASGVLLPVTWGDLGPRLVESGALDAEAFRKLSQARGALPPEVDAILNGSATQQIKMTPENADELLNVLWAVGLANKNPVLEQGPMMDPNYGGADRFASTGGWSLAVGNPMSHYSMHALMMLTPQQQALVEGVSKNIYRPCCGNSTYFPDCNHGMAMLGLLEMMAAQGASEQQMYATALAVNSYWFPSQYRTIAQSFANEKRAWDQVDPKLALSAEYSSGSGYAAVAARLKPTTSSGGGSCGV